MATQQVVVPEDARHLKQREGTLAQLRLAQMYVADSQSGSASSSTSSDAAVTALRKVLELLPDNVDALHMIGVIFLDDGKVRRRLVTTYYYYYCE